MHDYEKLGQFYLGREYDRDAGSCSEMPLLYDSRDLLTHAVCLGMTGSGKTGLCIGLLEEAAIDGIPSIVVDPKGDLANLLLTFPELDAHSLRPWINEEDAQRAGVTPDEYARQQAELWRNGLADWDQDVSRIQRLRNAVEMTVYTPGSNAGRSVSILESFAAPSPAVIGDADMYRERLNTTVTSLLSLLGIDADPIQSREHILLSTILDHAWKQGQSLDLAALITSIQTPPIDRIGVFDLDAFYPQSDRFALAMKLNGLLAAPGFDVWLSGDPLDLQSLMYTPAGKPRVCIFSIAHLNDTERMFFMSILLLETLSWMRAQSGTSSLRAIFYMDEIAGYLPPVANPPSKGPLLTLMKQGRAFGLGCVLATQNPIDLDYKALSNTGTWFIGRLQTERDRDRVLDGLESIAAGPKFDRKELEHILSDLGKRVFLLNNVHEDGPVLFQTRWVMSYLRGPLTRDQIKLLTVADPAPVAAVATTSPMSQSATLVKKAVPAIQQRPTLKPSIPQAFLPLAPTIGSEAKIRYAPMLLGYGDLYYSNAKAEVATERKLSVLAELPDSGTRIDWDGASACHVMIDQLDSGPGDDDADYDEVPSSAGLAKSYTAWTRKYKDWLYRNQHLELLKSTALKTVSKPGEDERDFRIRLQLLAREKRDILAEKLRKRYARRITTLEDRVRRAHQKVEREKEQAKQQKLSTAMSIGATVLGALLGRKTMSTGTVGRASTAMNRAGRIGKEARDVARAEADVHELTRRLEDLQAELEGEIADLQQTIDPLTEELKSLVVKPRKTDISIPLLTLAWAPYHQDEDSRWIPAWSPTQLR